MNKKLNLEIRSPVVADAKDILDYLKVVGGETDNLTFGAEGHPNTVAQEEQFIAALSPSLNQIMLLGLIDGEIIAIGSLFGSNRERMKHSLELGISVKRAYWHQGVATLLINKLIEIARQSHHVIQITLTVISDNHRAKSLYQKLGFKETGIHARQLKINDMYKDTIIMVLPIKEITDD